MLNYCVCTGCTNSSLSGHRVHCFPDRKRSGVSFCAWVRFVQVKRRDFTASPVTINAVVCSAHFGQFVWDGSGRREGWWAVWGMLCLVWGSPWGSRFSTRAQKASSLQHILHSWGHGLAVPTQAPIIQKIIRKSSYLSLSLPLSLSLFLYEIYSFNQHFKDLSFSFWGFIFLCCLHEKPIKLCLTLETWDNIFVMFLTSNELERFLDSCKQ